MTGQIDKTATAAAALFRAPTEQVDSEWQQQTAHPILIRVAHLPARIGTTDTSNSQAELYATILLLELLPTGTPVIHIGDSAAERQRIITMRDDTTSTFRDRLRRLEGGCSKILVKRAQLALDDHAQATQVRWLGDGLLAHAQRRQLILNTLQRMSDNSKLWPNKYVDRHKRFASIKVDSHQLTPDGRPTGRYKTLVPCRFLVTINQTVDSACNFAMGKYGSNRAQLHMNTPKDIQGGDGRRFYISWNQQWLDQDIPRTVATVLDREMVRRAKTKPAQGLVWRAAEWCQDDMRRVGNEGAWRRILLGLAHAHTRGVYKSLNYRVCTWSRIQLVDHVDGDPTSMMQDSGGTYKDVYRACPFCHIIGAPDAQGNYHIGNRDHLHACCPFDHIRIPREKMEALLEQACRRWLATIASWSCHAGHAHSIEQTLHAVRTHIRIQEGAATQDNPVPWDKSPADNARPHLKSSNSNCQRRLGLTFHGPGTFPPTPECCTAADIPHLGILPDAIHEAVRSMHQRVVDDMTGASPPTVRKAEAELRRGWNNIRAVLMMRPLIMQRIISHQLNRLTAMLEQSISKPTPTVSPNSLTGSRRLADGKTCSRPTAANAPNDQQPPHKIKAHLCRGIACMRAAQQYGQHRRCMVHTERSKCPKCLTVYRAIAMATAMEGAACDDTTILADILEAHVRCNARNELTMIASVLEQHLGSSDRRWTIARDRQRCRMLSDAQRKAVRMICNTLCLPLHGITAGVDPTLTDSQRLVMQALARTWCPGTCAPPSLESLPRRRKAHRSGVQNACTGGDTTRQHTPTHTVSPASNSDMALQTKALRTRANFVRCCGSRFRTQ